MDCSVKRLTVRANRSILIPSVPVFDGIETGHGRQFLGSLFRASSKLAGGMGRFLPCGVGPHMFRLRHLGWNQCSHGLSLQDHWNLVTINAFVRYVAFFFGLSQGVSSGASCRFFEAPVLYCSFYQALSPLGFTEVGQRGW